MKTTKQDSLYLIYCANSTFCSRGFLKLSIVESSSLILSAGKRGKDAKAQQEEPENQEPVIEWKGQWVTTSPTGERVGKKLDGTAVELSNSLVSYASDPESGQVSQIAKES